MSRDSGHVEVSHSHDLKVESGRTVRVRDTNMEKWDYIWNELPVGQSCNSAKSEFSRRTSRKDPDMAPLANRPHSERKGLCRVMMSAVG